MLLPLVAKVNALPDLVEKVNGIEASIQGLSAKYDTILSKLDEQSSDVSALKRRVECLELDAPTGAAASSEQMKLQLNELEQYNRRLNIEVHGMAKEEHENLLERMNILACNLGLPELANSDLNALYRLPSRPGKEPVVIVQFVSNSLKEKWIESRSRLRTKEPKLRFFDHLTPTNKRLLWLARQRCEESGYRFVWQKNGHIFVRKSEGERAIRICDEGDLEKIEGPSWNGKKVITALNGSLNV